VTLPGRSDGSHVQPTPANQNFDFPIDLRRQPDAYEPAAVTNLFYMDNITHDIFY
jgi:hypothetical protein